MATKVAVLTALIEARRLINNGWSQKTFARDSNGKMCDWKSEEAKSFCTIGAIYKSTNCDADICREALNTLQRQLDQFVGYMLAHYNDNRGRKKGEVLDLFDRAIAAQMSVETVVAESKELEFA